MDDDRPICYYKSPITEFMKADAEYKWVQLIPDPVVKSVKDPNKAGLLSFKITVSEHEINPK